MRKTSYQIARSKIINILSEIDEEEITEHALFAKLRGHGFKPPYGRKWDSEKLLKVLEWNKDRV